jgi:hypothetical protein
MTIIHMMAEMADWDREPTLVKFLCGESALVTDDGVIHPASIDFVGPTDPNCLVDCAKCLARMALNRRTHEAAL